MHPYGVITTLILSILAIFAPPRWAALSLIASTLILTQGQSVSVLGFNLFSTRIIILVGFLRVIIQKRITYTSLTTTDKALVLLYSYTTCIFLIRSKTDHAYVIGDAADIIICYFAFRALIKTPNDIWWILKSIAILFIPYSASLIYETFSQVNPFKTLGSIELSGEKWMRGGRVRCQGSFRHASLLGTLGATFMPLYIGMYFTKQSKAIATIGMITCLTIVFTSNSGGPLSTLAIGLTCWLFWKFRYKMKTVRLGLIVLLVALAIFMKAPIWYLPAKASSITGGDGWHRSYLMDIAFKKLDQWWLAGMPLEFTGDWFHYVIEVTGAADITNEYISFGIRAGLPAIILFVSLLVILYKAIGQANLISSPNQKTFKILTWSLGVVLTTHIFNWFGITYFDQTYVIWCFHIALIAGAAAWAQETASNRETTISSP